MADGNLQREELLPSERALAYKGEYQITPSYSFFEKMNLRALSCCLVLVLTVLTSIFPLFFLLSPFLYLILLRSGAIFYLEIGYVSIAKNVSLHNGDHVCTLTSTCM